MAMQKGRDMLLKVKDGEGYLTLGAARIGKFLIDNNPLDVSSLNCNGVKELQASGGLQSMQISMEGIFKDSAAEEKIRSAAFNRSSETYLLLFPNGDSVEGRFAVAEYRRDGSYNGLEAFSLSLLSSGAATYKEKL